MKNFFWNQNAEFPICDVCKLILFCIPVGISNIKKTTKENVNGQVIYREKEISGFVNYDTSINELMRTNNYLSQTSSTDKLIYNPINPKIKSNNSNIKLDILNNSSFFDNFFRLFISCSF